jgi:snRNA-activating protein complex (SNAPc), subunit 3
MIRRKTTGEEVKKRWEILLARKRPRSDAVLLDPDDEDPFDCSKIAVLPSKQMVKSVLRERIEKWKALERRKVCKETEAGAPKPKGWHVSRVRLPHNFDYASKRSQPPDPQPDGDKVVSLQDPTKLISYEQELWKIFKDTPTVEELEKDRMEGAECSRMRQAVEYMEANIQQAYGLQSHANVRLRMKDRHGLPDPPHLGPKVTTIRLEVWQRNLKNQPSMAAHRLELEFLGSQTLEDVHASIVELSEDEFWEKSDEGKTTSSKERSGFFFIEDTFYKAAGHIDYTAPVLTWLDGEKDSNEKVHPPRRAYLGIQPSKEIQIKPMSDSRLDKITWRLGTRYVHVHHGDVECAIFLSDIQQGPKQLTSYPLIHDDWVPSYRSVFCEACGKNKPGAFATKGGNPMTDGTPRVLCSVCFDALFWDEPSTPFAKFSIWRNQIELSAGLEPPDLTF